MQDREARRLPNLVGAIARRSALLRDKLVPRHLDVLVFAAKGAINAVEAVTRAISVDALRVVPAQRCVLGHDFAGRDDVWPVVEPRSSTRIFGREATFAFATKAFATATTLVAATTATIVATACTALETTATTTLVATTLIATALVAATGGAIV